MLSFGLWDWRSTPHQGKLALSIGISLYAAIHTGPRDKIIAASPTGIDTRETAESASCSPIGRATRQSPAQYRQTHSTSTLIHGRFPVELPQSPSGEPYLPACRSPTN